jgi:hypothetical protein
MFSAWPAHSDNRAGPAASSGRWLKLANGRRVGCVELPADRPRFSNHLEGVAAGLGTRSVGGGFCCARLGDGPSGDVTSGPADRPKAGRPHPLEFLAARVVFAMLAPVGRRVRQPQIN